MANRAHRFDSRQSMNDKQFEIFHYRDQKMETVGVHHHDYYEVYFLLGGTVSFQVEGKLFLLEPGDLLLINPQELHQAQVGQNAVYERYVLWLSRSYLDQLGGGQSDLSACFDQSASGHTNLLRPDKVHRAILQDLLKNIDTEFYSDASDSRLYAQGLLTQFLVEVNRLIRNSVQKPKKVEEPDLISRVLAYIGTHYQESLTLADVASEFYVSKYYLAHEFSARVGTSVYRYITFRRLMQAKELIASGMTPGAVYQNCGFGDYANFYRAFKAEYGISPREFAAQIDR